MSDGAEGLEAALDQAYDVAVVDVMLPKRDGLSVIEELRRKGVMTPVLILSARQTVDDRVRGLQAGGDDYLTKPFAFAELLARVQALVRRASRTPEPTTLTVEDLVLDLLTNIVDVLVSRLRDKVDRPFETKLIHTVRGVGYVLRV